MLHYAVLTHQMVLICGRLVIKQLKYRRLNGYKCKWYVKCSQNIRTNYRNNTVDNISAPKKWTTSEVYTALELTSNINWYNDSIVIKVGWFYNLYKIRCRYCSIIEIGYTNYLMQNKVWYTINQQTIINYHINRNWPKKSYDISSKSVHQPVFPITHR